MKLPIEGFISASTGSSEAMTKTVKLEKTARLIMGEHVVSII